VTDMAPPNRPEGHGAAKRFNPDRCAKWIGGSQCHHFRVTGSSFCAMHKRPEPNPVVRRGS
jgi:hypothetical protein